MVDVFPIGCCRGEIGLPQYGDSAIASEVSRRMLHDAIANQPPVRGTPG